MTEPAEAARSAGGAPADPYDVVVVGGGTAGLSGALVLSRARRSVLVVDAGRPRNAPAAGVHNYLGRDGTPPGELLAAGRAEVTGYGGQVVAGEVVAAHPSPGPQVGFTVELADGRQVRSRRLLVTTGLVDELPQLPGVAERWGRDVLHCPYCHGWEARDQHIAVLGSAMGVHTALMWRQWSEHVTLLLHTSPEPTEQQCSQLAARGVTVVPGEVAGLQVEADRLRGVRLRDGGAVPCQSLVVTTGLAVRSEVLASLGVQPVDLRMGELVVGNRIAAEPSGATAGPGVWVAGNVTDPLAQAIGSAAAGLAAGAAVNADLIADDTARAVAAATAGPSGPPAVQPAGGYVGDPAVQAEWDGRYADREQLWSGEPNGALVAEVADLPPGRALDVGCGEGADAVWLARRGWDVTALEVSGVALQRATGHARDAGVALRAVHAELAEAALPPASFDLVSAMYPALLRTSDAAAERALLAAVAPGGVLLLVHHAGMETHQPHDGGFDPADYVWPSMVAALLDDDWQVEVDEQRPRDVPSGGAGAHHVDDVLLRARRLR